MKKIYLVLAGVQPDPTFIAPGIWSMPDQTDKVWLIIQNQTPNQGQNDDYGGYNALDCEAGSPFTTGFSVSVKQAVNKASEYAETPPQGVLRNYRTLLDCATAVWEGTDTQGVMLFDNN